MREHLKILIAAGFSNGEIAEFSAANRTDVIADGIRQGVACGCDPTVYHDEEFTHRDPFEALAGMSADERRELRAFAVADLTEFFDEPEYQPVSQAQVTEQADRSLAFFASRGIYPVTPWKGKENE
jgi:hypothetical protein